MKVVDLENRSSWIHILGDLGIKGVPNTFGYLIWGSPGLCGYLCDVPWWGVYNYMKAHIKIEETLLWAQRIFRGLNTQGPKGVLEGSQREH